MGYEYILFDLDGTLTDSAIGITNSIEYSLQKYGIEVPDKKSLYKFIGPPLLESFQKFYGFTEEKAFEASGYFHEYYSAKGMLENAVYDGIADMLGSLKSAGKTLVVATSKPEEYAIKILEYFNLMEHLDFVSGSSMDAAKENKTDVIRAALEKINAEDLSKIVMVGDREHDIIGANNCGIDSIGVLYGFGSRKELEAEKATYIVETVEDLQNFLLGK